MTIKGLNIDIVILDFPENRSATYGEAIKEFFEKLTTQGLIEKLPEFISEIEGLKNSNK